MPQHISVWARSRAWRRTWRAPFTAFGEAERLYTAASNNEGLTEVLLRRGAALDGMGDAQRARVDLDHALALAMTAKSTGQRIRAQMALSSVIATEGKLSDAERMASAAVQEALAAGLDIAAAEGLLDLAATFDDLAQFDKASHRSRTRGEDRDRTRGQAHAGSGPAAARGSAPPSARDRKSP